MPARRIAERPGLWGGLAGLAISAAALAVEGSRGTEAEPAPEGAPAQVAPIIEDTKHQAIDKPRESRGRSHRHGESTIAAARMLRIERAWRREDETPRSIHVPSPDPAEEALKAAALEAKYEPELWRVARSMMSEPYPRGFGRQGTRRRATDGRWRAPTPSAQRAERRDAYLFMLGKGPRVILQSAEWDRVTLEFAKELSRQCREWWLKEMLGTWPRDKRARQELRVKIPALIRPHEAGLTLSHHVLELMYGMTREPRFRWRVSKMWVALADKNLTYDIVTQASQGVEDSFVKMRQPPWIRSPETWRWRWSRWDRWMERERREKHMKALDQNLWVTCPLCDLKLLVPAGGVEVECPTCGGLVQTPRESP